MNQSSIRSYTRYIIREESTDTGSLLGSGNTILDEYIQDAMEELLMDITPHLNMDSLMTSETIDLVADQENYTLTGNWLQIMKVEKNVTDESPRMLDWITPLQNQFKGVVGATTEDPTGFILVGNTLYLRQIPSGAESAYLRVYYSQYEGTMAESGPAVIPAYAHRALCWKAAELIAAGIGDADSTPYEKQYEKKKEKFIKVYEARVQQEPIFVRESAALKSTVTGRQKTEYDEDWP